MVDFIIPTYNRTSSLNMILASLQAQTDPDWTAKVMVDGAKQYPAVVQLLNKYNDPRIKKSLVEPRANDWGHTPRELGKQTTEQEYVVMTGDDNYYVPTFVQELKLAVKDKPGMVYWNMVHNHYDYQLFICSPGFNQIDIGAFATRSDLAKQIKLNTSYAADGEFVEEFKVRFPSEKIVKIKKVLYVHN